MTDTGLARRLEKLERDNRRHKRSWMGVLVLLAALGGIYAEQPIPTVIKAHVFELTDSAGKVRIEMKPGEIRFFDDQGVPRVAMGISSGEPLLLLEGKSGTVGLDTTSRLGTPGVWLLDAKGKLRAAMQIVGDGSMIRLSGSDGEGHVTLSQFPDGPLISLADAQGFDMDLGRTAIGSPITGASEHTSAASIVMFGKDKLHRVIWKAP